MDPAKKDHPAAIYLIGTGNVGKAFLSMLDPGRHVLHGVTNSRKMLLDTEGIRPAAAAEAVEEKGIQADLSRFLEKMEGDPSRNRICVDCSAGTGVALRHADILSAGISLVTANKLAVAGKYAYYRSLMRLCEKKHVHYAYETTVGAALPVISTLRRLRSAGDPVRRIEAVPSGTLSYCFNRLSEGRSFSSVVRDARDKGYTEPDPRQDLQGMDAARKAIIMARESGEKCEMEDAVPPRIISRSALHAESMDSFFKQLRKEDPSWEERVRRLRENEKKLRYMTVIEKGKIDIRLAETGSGHPFYNLSGTENIFAFYTRQFSRYPLIIRGEGAGGALTASGVLADVEAVMENLSQ